jgi:dephospho-CoA kinase
MKLLGITGGIGMGKSMTAELLSQRGIPVVDTDVLARNLVEPGQPALAEIVDALGRDLLDENGRLRRRVLAGIVFADKQKRELLESILHPRIRSSWMAQAALWRKESRACAAVIIPLLFETGAGEEFECVICVACSPGSQRQRLATRGWTPEEIDKRNASQWPVQAKMDHSHRVIWTEPSVEVHAAQLDRILRK